MTYAELQQDTPRLVIEYKRDGDKDMYAWGIVGSIPITSLVGRMVRVQAMVVGDSWIEECDQSALVIAWDAAEREFSTFLHPGIPEDSLVGMLEIVKATLVSTHVARQMAAQQTILLGPDGNPMRA